MAQLQNDNEMYTLQQILQLLPIGKPYQWFRKHLLPCVVGAKLWHKKHNKELIGAIATCSDEAFALLTLEHYHERWMALARWHVDNAKVAHKDKAPKHIPGLLCTNSSLGKKNGCSHCLQGWASEGYLPFNELYMLVGLNCRHCIYVENDFLTIWQSNGKKDIPHCQVTVMETEDDIFPANNLVGLARPVDHVANKIR
jgi:hypothetical protein